MTGHGQGARHVTQSHAAFGQKEDARQTLRRGRSFLSLAPFGLADDFQQPFHIAFRRILPGRESQGPPGEGCGRLGIRCQPVEQCHGIFRLAIEDCRAETLLQPRRQNNGLGGSEGRGHERLHRRAVGLCVHDHERIDFPQEPLQRRPLALETQELGGDMELGLAPRGPQDQVAILERRPRSDASQIPLTAMRAKEANSKWVVSGAPGRLLRMSGDDWPGLAFHLQRIAQGSGDVCRCRHNRKHLRRGFLARAALMDHRPIRHDDRAIGRDP